MMRMKTMLAFLCCSALCSVPALAQATSTSANDQKFINMAAQTDMTEAHLGQMAADQSSSPAVKDFAKMLVTDHTSDYQQLGTIAAKAGDTVPQGLDAAQNKMIAPFNSLKGTAFDRRFVREMISGHEKAIAEYKREASEGSSADVKAYANQTLTVLQKHLDAARNLEKELGKERT